MRLAALFLVGLALTLTLSPAVREHSWAVTYRWIHWIGLAVWFLLFSLLHQRTMRLIPERDPFLLPIAAVMTGWGLMEIWRMTSTFGLRQTIWLAISLLAVWAGLRIPDALQLLRRYKYIWLTSGLLLTGLTFFFGTYPEGAGSGPRLWLGCCGVYFQPSEPLKLLLIVYLAAYLADNLHLRASVIQLITPTLILAGLALVLLVAQRDLGTATQFIFLYIIVLYIATGRPRVLVLAALAVGLAAIGGYFSFDVVRLRIDAWLNPWLDPSGRSYQIVQSLLAISAGDILGSGLGLGNPSLVPVAHSDFIYSAIAEESGLVGSLGLILLLGLLALRGLRAALHAPDAYQRYLAAGLTAYLVSQSILIIGGNLRLLPLTGVTLPFVSYGGSSLLISCISLLILLLISNQPDEEPALVPNPRPYVFLGAILLAGLGLAGLFSGWWGVVRGPDLLGRNDNPRRAVADRYVRRGALLDRQGLALNATSGEKPGEYSRVNLYPPLSPVVGYTHPIYGLAGLESSQDPYLRGLKGNPAILVAWHQILFSQPPQGLDLRLSLDLNIQRQVDLLLGDHQGAVVLLNPETGEILAMASHPYFDPNHLDQNWNQLIKDPSAPLVNRVTLGQYPPGAALGPFLLAESLVENKTPNLPAGLVANGSCALVPDHEPATWAEAVSLGCSAPLASLGEQLGPDRLGQLFERLGFYSSPDVPLHTAAASPRQPIHNVRQAAQGQGDLSVSPIQMALAAASLGSSGQRPAPRLVIAMDTPDEGWKILPPFTKPADAFPSGSLEGILQGMNPDSQMTWESTALARTGDQKTVTWYLTGTLPRWQGAPLTLVVLLEENNPAVARSIGHAIIQDVLHP